MRDRSRAGAPEGFVREGSAARALWIRADLADSASALGLERPGSWEEAISDGRSGSGRGAIGRIALPGGPVAIVKRMRRGGLVGPLWRGRFARPTRLMENLTVPEIVIARGIPTARPIALLLLEGPPRLWRAWLAVEEIPGAVDLATRLRDSGHTSREDLAAALAVVRRAHDAGVEHTDLNLGNVLVRCAPPDPAEAFLIDLDRTRIRGGSLGFRKRRAALRRLERSYRKRFGRSGPIGEDPAAAFREAYAMGDGTLASRLGAGRTLHRILIALHRPGVR